MAYLERRAQCWYAGHDIPADVQPIFRKRRFFQSLQTRDRDDAKRLKAALEARWREDIERARKQRQGLSYAWSPLSDVEALQRRAKFMAAAPDERDAERERIRQDVYDVDGPQHLQTAMTAHGEDGAAEQARRFVAIATGGLTATEDHVEEYLATLRVAPKTLDIKRMNLRRFVARFPHTSDVVRREVQRWVNELGAAGKAPKTLQRDLSDMRGYWRYLQALQLVSDEVHPLRDLVLPKPEKKGDKRRPFEAGEVVQLWRHARGPWRDQELADLIELGMWTGCRIEELCALKVEHVGKAGFRVVDAKTNAGLREVPIHKELAATMARLVQASKDGFVLTGLTLNKYGDRSNAIGKRFGRLKAELGFGGDHVFHSIRKTVATLLENAKVPENVAADILGHEKKTMTYGLYSDGASLAVKARALGKLRYPA